jgi:hypothetical protein
MAISEHATEFAGKTVKDWDESTRIAAPERMRYRISLDWDAAQEGRYWTDRFAVFLDDPDAEKVTGLIVGVWGQAFQEDSSPVVEALVAARARLPNLIALFLGDITYEECEISWITQSDVSPLFSAYPRLEHFRVRGGNGLRFGGLQHAHLKSLVVETGGLPVLALRDVLSADLPALEHLELWLGTDAYGWDGSVEDLAPLLAGELFPHLRYLGLRNSDIADQIAVAIANAPILKRIRVLDLSLGTLSDTGAAALLTSPDIRKLEKLDIHHHYLSEEMVSWLTGVPSETAKQQLPLEGIDSALTQSPGLGIEVDAGDRQEADKDDGEIWRYVAVGE